MGLVSRLERHSPARILAETASSVFVTGMTLYGLARLSTMTFGARGIPQSPEVVSFRDYLSTLQPEYRVVLSALGNPFLRVTHSSATHITTIGPVERQPIIDLERLARTITRRRNRAQDVQQNAEHLARTVEQARAAQIVEGLQLTGTDPLLEIDRLTTESTGAIIAPILTGLIDRALGIEGSTQPATEFTHAASVQKRMTDHADSLRNQARIASHQGRSGRSQAERLTDQAKLVDRMVTGEPGKPETSLPVIVSRAIELGFAQRVLAVDLSQPEHAPLFQSIEAYLHTRYPGETVRPLGAAPDALPILPPPAQVTIRRGWRGVLDRVRHTANRTADAVAVTTSRLADHLPSILVAEARRPNLRADLLTRLERRVTELESNIDRTTVEIARLELVVQRDGAEGISQKKRTIHAADLERAIHAVQDYGVQLAIAKPVTQLLHKVNTKQWYEEHQQPTPVI